MHLQQQQHLYCQHLYIFFNCALQQSATFFNGQWCWPAHTHSHFSHTPQWLLDWLLEQSEKGKKAKECKAAGIAAITDTHRHSEPLWSSSSSKPAPKIRKEKAVQKHRQLNKNSVAQLGFRVNQPFKQTCFNSKCVTECDLNWWSAQQQQQQQQQQQSQLCTFCCCSVAFADFSLLF